MIYKIDYDMRIAPKLKLPTDLSSASLFGVGQVPGSRVIARKKLYAHRPNERAKIRWANAWDSVSKCRV